LIKLRETASCSICGDTPKPPWTMVLRPFISLVPGPSKAVRVNGGVRHRRKWYEWLSSGAGFIRLLTDEASEWPFGGVPHWFLTGFLLISQFVRTGNYFQIYRY
jgi:hypothetical protein